MSWEPRPADVPLAVGVDTVAITTEEEEEELAKTGETKENNTEKQAEAQKMLHAWTCWCGCKNSDGDSACTTCTAQRFEDVSLSPDLESKGEDAAATTAGEELTEAQLLALVVRTDLGMGPGKIAEQCCLATLAAAWRAQRDGLDEEEQQSWLEASSQRQFLACEGDSAFSKLQARSGVCGVPTFEFVVGDRAAVLVVGPATVEELDLVTGQLERVDWSQGPGDENQAMDDESLSKSRSNALALLDQVLNTRQASATKKCKPNAKCHCGSTKKYKKCCATKDLAQKQRAAELNTTLVAVLGKHAAGFQKGSSSASDKLVKQRGERVASFRKQGEYGAKKYIKP